MAGALDMPTEKRPHEMYLSRIDEITFGFTGIRGEFVGAGTTIWALNHDTLLIPTETLPN